MLFICDLCFVYKKVLEVWKSLKVFLRNIHVTKKKYLNKFKNHKYYLCE